LEWSLRHEFRPLELSRGSLSSALSGVKE
jgi:hypothetical protein